MLNTEVWKQLIKIRGKCSNIPAECLNNSCKFHSLACELFNQRFEDSRRSNRTLAIIKISSLSLVEEQNRRERLISHRSVKSHDLGVNGLMGKGRIWHFFLMQKFFAYLNNLIFQVCYQKVPLSSFNEILKHFEDDW